MTLRSFDTKYTVYASFLSHPNCSHFFFPLYVRYTCHSLHQIEEFSPLYNILCKYFYSSSVYFQAKCKYQLLKLIGIEIKPFFPSQFLNTHSLLNIKIIFRCFENEFSNIKQYAEPEENLQEFCLKLYEMSPYVAKFPFHYHLFSSFNIEHHRDFAP